ncbi:hypothetical protein H6F89_21820 [Cyanobacteria bacterium FACHB-63]|nr:hypothetical protein [Cyanobacteria bacterium FACHB-63]
MPLTSLGRRNFLGLLAGSAIVSACNAQSKNSQVQAQSTSAIKLAKNFQIYDSLMYREKPDLGLPKVQIYGGAFWQKGDQARQIPVEKAVRDQAQYAATHFDRFVIDIEHWPLDIRKDSPEAVQASMQKIIQIYDWMKDEVPKLSIGMYAFPPIRDYWTPARPTPAGMGAWRRANEFLRPLASRVDFLAPSLYTFYDNPRGWEVYAKANIIEAQQFGKPITPVLWCRFHVSNKKLRGIFIPDSFWLTQLQTVRNSGMEGVILWDSNSKPGSRFDPEWDWWQTTLKFAKTL